MGGQVVFLPWMRTPVTLRSDECLPLEQVAGLDVRLAAALRQQGMLSLFPVQVSTPLAAGASQVVPGIHPSD
jgi:hypothetical protein